VVAAAVMTVVVALAARAGLLLGLLVAAPAYLAALVLLRAIVPAELRELLKREREPGQEAAPG
jgi:hypothetical protein